MASAVKGFDITDRLDRICCPVLIMGVYEDAVLGADATMEIAEKLDEQPGFRLFMYIGYGHAAFDTAPDYRQRIWKFLTDQRP
jgi:homoserine acetyltransferase